MTPAADERRASSCAVPAPAHGVSSETALRKEHESRRGGGLMPIASWRRPSVAVAVTSAFALAALLAAGCASAPREVTRRDRFPLDPREELSGPFPDGVDRGWAALVRGDPKAAAREFGSAREAGAQAAAQVGAIEADVLLGRFEAALEECRDALDAGEATVPLLVACGEATGRGGRPAEGFRLYRQVLARTADRAGLNARAEELRVLARDALAGKARVDSDEHLFAEARERIAEAILIAPESAALRALAGEIEDAADEPQNAFRRYREAFAIDPTNVAVAERVGTLALEQNEHALAVTVFDALAKSDARFRPKAEEARLAFRVVNWPALEREAAHATRLTRASAATLVWWMFPEVREARVSAGIIATDAVSRRDTRAFSRAVALGLLEVDRETHRGNPDAPLTQASAARLLVRLLAVVRPGGGLPCLEKGGGARATRTAGEAIRAAEACGLWKDGDGSVPGGPAFTRALDRVRALASASSPASEPTDE